MAVFRAQLQWIKDKGTGDTQVIDNWNTINIRLSSELKNNMMTISLQNDFNSRKPRIYNSSSTGKIVGEGAFNVDDKFKFYAKYDTDNSGLDFSENSNDLIFFGDLREVKSRTKEKSTIQLKCTDRSFNLLNRIGWANYRSNDTNAPNGQGWTAPLMIKDIVRQRANTNKPGTAKNQFIYDNTGVLTPSQNADTEYLLIDARLSSEGGFIQDNRSISIDKNGNPVSRTIGTPDSTNALFPTGPIATRNYNFPLKTYSKVGKPIYEMMLNMSQIDLTNTENEQDPDSAFKLIIQRAMRFYIDEKMRLHWFYPTNTIDSIKSGTSLNLTMGNTTDYEIKEHDLDYVIFEVINFIYFEAGVDMNGDSILGFKYDPTSGSPTLKDSKRSWPRIAQNMKDADLVSNGGSITKDASQEGGYAYPSAYPVTPKWNPEVVVNSDAQYNQAFKEKARETADAKANTIISGASSQRWKGTIQNRFKNFTVTDLLSYTSIAGGMNAELLRIQDIQHNFQKSGAFTTLTVESDGKELEV